MGLRRGMGGDALRGASSPAAKDIHVEVEICELDIAYHYDMCVRVRGDGALCDAASLRPISSPRATTSVPVEAAVTICCQNTV